MAQSIFPVNGSGQAVRPAEFPGIASGEDFEAALTPYDADATRLTDHETGQGGTVHVRVAVQGNPGEIKIVPLPLAYAYEYRDVYDTSDFKGMLVDEEFPVVDASSEKTIISPYGYEYADVKVSHEPSAGSGEMYNIKISIKTDNDKNQQNGQYHSEYNNWFLVIKSENPVRAVWTTGTTDAEARLPWLHIEETELDWSQDAMGERPPLLPGETRERHVRVANFGTGALLLDTADVGEGFTIPEPPEIPALSEVSVPVRFTAPSQGGIVEHVVSFGRSGDESASASGGDSSSEGEGDSDEEVPAQHDTATTSSVPDNEHNGTVTLRAQVALMDLVLALDTSGSMRRGRDGSFDPPDGERRWDFLKDATQQLVLGYRDFLMDRLDATEEEVVGAGRLSVAAFPNPNGPEMAATLFPPPDGGSPPSAGNSLLTEDVAERVERALRIEPQGGTPMGEGIAHAVGREPDDFGLFTMDGAEQDNSRWLLLLSDGAHNTGDIEPAQFYEEDSVADFDEKRVRVLTVAHGEENAGGVDYALMNDLATNGFEGGAGRALVARSGEGPNDLSKALRTCLRQTLGLDEPDDPEGHLDSTHRDAYHDFVLTELDDRFAIVVEWNTQNSSRIEVELVTPRCERITESKAREQEGITFESSRRFKYFFVSKSFLWGDNESDRIGTWTLRVRLKPTGEGDEVGAETYVYSVLSYSSLSFDATVADDRSVTGEPIEVFARLGNAGAPISNAGVRMTVDAPAWSADSWLALQEVDESLLDKAADELNAAGITNPFAIKVRALQMSNQSVPDSRRSYGLSMEEVEPGVYRGLIERTGTPGNYRLHVVASAETRHGARFRRERTLDVYVEPRPNAVRSDVALHFQSEKREVAIQVWLRDQFGNAILFDPASRRRLVIEAKHAEPTGEMTTKLDGSYIQTIKYDGKHDPVIEISFDGQVFYRRELTIPEHLRWMDKVVEYRRGAQSQEGEHAFDDPQAGLGPVVSADDAFVALGRRGSIELTAQRRRIRARDLTVFVKNEAPRRAYRVAIRVPTVPPRGQGSGGWKHEWVDVGSSKGFTETFPLREYAGWPILAVRVLDFSSGSGGPSGKPSRADGVLLQGVGFTPYRHRWPTRAESSSRDGRGTRDRARRQPAFPPRVDPSGA